ncbi:MAG: alpha/beta hydrolase [Burkholderiales bacterium]|nr:alpha/beta hydrolase [Burkholderiales bacterium]
MTGESLCRLRAALTVLTLLFLSGLASAQGFARKDVTFVSQGLKLAAWYYVPGDMKAGEKRPAIVMAHGFSAPKEALLQNFAERFAAAGFVVAVFDYRYLGASEGEPRGQIFPTEQIEDYRNAITWTQMQEEVDPERIGVRGTSYSGAHVLQLSAFDRRVKAVVSQVMLVDGLANAQRLNRADNLPLTFAFLAGDRAQRYTSGKVNYLPVVGPEGSPSALPTPESYDFFMKVVQTSAPRWENRVTLESIEKFLEYNPGASIHRISPTPLLMVVARDDRLTPTDLAIDAYERAREPKKLAVFEGGHFDAYVEPAIRTTAGEATEWFRRWLMQ